MKQLNRARRQFRIRKYLVGTTDRPRLAVYRSSAHIYAQIIDDTVGKTLVAESDLEMKKSASAEKKTAKVDKAMEVGKKLAEKAVKKGIKEVVFDRGGFLYHGRVKAVADGAREGGLKF